MKKTILIGIALTSLVFAQGFMKNGNGQTNAIDIKFSSMQKLNLTDAQ